MASDRMQRDELQATLAVEMQPQLGHLIAEPHLRRRNHLDGACPWLRIAGGDTHAHKTRWRTRTNGASRAELETGSCFTRGSFGLAGPPTFAEWTPRLAIENAYAKNRPTVK